MQKSLRFLVYGKIVCLSGSSQCCWCLWMSKQKITVSFACSLNIEYSVKSKISHMEKLEENKELESEAAFWMIDKSQLLVCFCSQSWAFHCLPSPPEESGGIDNGTYRLICFPHVKTIYLNRRNIGKWDSISE